MGGRTSRLRARRVALTVIMALVATRGVVMAPAALAATFGTGGKVTTDFAGSDDKAFAVVRQPDGKLVAAGRTVTGGNIDFALVRYKPDGTLDTTFGTAGTGKVTTDFAGGADV